jgi:hypothetical protein
VALDQHANHCLPLVPASHRVEDKSAHADTAAERHAAYTACQFRHIAYGRQGGVTERAGRGGEGQGGEAQHLQSGSRAPLVVSSFLSAHSRTACTCRTSPP